MMQITRAEIIAVTLLLHQSSLTNRHFFEFCNQAVSLMLRQYNQPGSGPDIAATVDCLTDITTINHR